MYGGFVLANKNCLYLVTLGISKMQYEKKIIKKYRKDYSSVDIKLMH